MDETVTVDHRFLAQALTVAMQMRDELEEEDYVIVKDMMIDDNGYLTLLIERKTVTIN